MLVRAFVTFVHIFGVAFTKPNTCQVEKVQRHFTINETAYLASVGLSNVEVSFNSCIHSFIHSYSFIFGCQNATEPMFNRLFTWIGVIRK